MNPKTPPGRIRHKQIISILLLASLLLGLAFSAPALAAAFPPRAEQGTVPPPPPTRGNDDEDDNEQDEFPTATPTSGAPAQDPAAQAAAIPAQNGAATLVGRVVSPRLNVRSGPALSFGSLGQYLQNDPVTIQFRDGSGQWFYTCCVAGTTTSGWSSASFIQTEFDPALAVSLLPVYPGLEQAATPAPAAATPTPRALASGALTAVVDAQPRLIMRDAPGTEGAIVGRVNDGTTVEVIARNEAGDWWYICCVDGSTTEGWANASFLVSDFDAADALSLLPLQGASDFTLPTPTPRALPFIPKPIKLSTATPTATALSVEVPAAATSTPVVTATPAAIEPTPTLLPEEEATPGAAAPAAPVADAPPAPVAQQSMTSLTAVAWQEPAFAAPGDTVLLRWLISNTGSDVARNVELRNELPVELALQAGAGSLNADFTSQHGNEGRSVFALEWAEIPAGESVSATVAVILSPEMAHGSVLRNLAAIGAQNAAGLTAGITISTPPSTLPTFK